MADWVVCSFCAEAANVPNLTVQYRASICLKVSMGGFFENEIIPKLLFGNNPIFLKVMNFMEI